MKLKQLLRGLAEAKVIGSKELVVTGVSTDSRRVGPGYLFIARRGEVHDGTQFIPDAMAAGATAILTDLPDPSLSVTQIIHPDPASCEAPIAAAFYGQPSQALFSVGVTGTNGKTTTAYIIRHLLQPCGLIGTIEYLIGDRTYQASHTTPQVIDVQRMLREMVQNRCRAAVMEVTSHGLDQGRVDGVGFDVGVFTNLTQDHLDYHKTLENYAAAKARLFSGLSPTATAVVNNDDPWKEVMLSDCRAEVFTFGLNEGAHLYASDITCTSEGSMCDVHYQGQCTELVLPLVGLHNLRNALAALAVGLVFGRELEQLCMELSQAPQIAGRLERVPNELGLSIFVDFAHTPDALQNVLEALSPLHTGRMITVFGCGGDRDREKRPIMGSVAAKHSNIALVTSDNPRSEDPDAICADILKGMRMKGDQKPICEPDRRKAIEQAIALAEPGDCIVIAGKGHERCQIVGARRLPFDDCQVVREACEKLATKA